MAVYGRSDNKPCKLRFSVAVVHHTDAEREYAYGRKSAFGHLDEALEAAVLNKWTVVDMKQDGMVVFPFER